MADPSADLGFEFKLRKCGDVEIRRLGRLATILRGTAAEEFLTKADKSSDAELQQTMARLTGNYKRGNERTAADHPKNRAREVFRSILASRRVLAKAGMTVYAETGQTLSFRIDRRFWNPEARR